MMRPQMVWTIAYVGIILVACTVFATKMVWYATPSLPALAALAAIACVESAKRRAGWLVLAAIAWFSVYQVSEPSWLAVTHKRAAALALVCAWQLIAAPLARDCWPPRLAAVFILVPLAFHFTVIRGAILHGDSVASWTELGVDDEPWREFCLHLNRDAPGRPILLVGVPLNPAAYFYLHHLRMPVRVVEAKNGSIGERLKGDPRAVVITRVELAEPLRAMGFQDRFSEGALVLMSPTRYAAQTARTTENTSHP
jgi:hypothetical protein